MRLSTHDPTPQRTRRVRRAKARPRLRRLHRRLHRAAHAAIKRARLLRLAAHDPATQRTRCRAEAEVRALGLHSAHLRTRLPIHDAARAGDATGHLAHRALRLHMRRDNAAILRLHRTRLHLLAGLALLHERTG